MPLLATEAGPAPDPPGPPLRNDSVLLQGELGYALEQAEQLCLYLQEVQNHFPRVLCYQNCLWKSFAAALFVKGVRLCATVNT